MKYKGYLIDLDGTAYLGSKRIESAKDFVNKLEEKKINYLFLSNNSSKTQEDVADKLKSHGYKINPENIFTSAMATAMYLNENYQNKNAFIIGDKGLKTEVNKTAVNIVDNENCDVVVIGYDNKLNYSMLETAAIAVNNGAHLVSTNPDRALPSERGNIPGNGAITKAIEYATGVDALYIGKPSAIITEYAIEILQVKRNEVVMIGDNYNTDIMCGINASIDTIHVETGLSTREEVEKEKIQPTMKVKDLSCLLSEV